MGQAPGWYRDPFHRGQERYWDGKLWTQGTRPEGGAEGTTASAVGSEAAGLVGESLTASPAPFGAPQLVGQHAVASSAVDPARGTPAAEEPFYSPLGAPVQAVVTQPSGGPTSWTEPTMGLAHPKRRDRQQRRTALGLGAAALLLVAGGVSTALVLGGTSIASAQEAVANAATQTVNAQTADVTISMDMSTQGLNESINGNGSFDFAQKTGTMSLTIPVEGQQDTLQEILDDSTVYVNVGALDGDLSNGKPWISENMSQLESVSGGFGTLDPASMVQRLQSLGGTVTTLGSTTYDETAVTEYSATLPASALEEELGKLPSLQQSMTGVNLPNMKWDIYVTNDDLLKAVTMPSFSVSDGGQSVSMDMTMVFSNYGTTVNVTPPPADQVEPVGGLGVGGLDNSGNTGNTGSTGSTGNTGNTGTGL